MNRGGDREDLRNNDRRVVALAVVHMYEVLGK